MAGQRRGRGERAGLTRELVLEAALGMVDRDGLAALSMRRLGAELGVEAMTLYHYVPNKDALLDGLIERVFRGVVPGEGKTWATSLREYAVSLRGVLLAHPGVLPLALSRPAVTPETLRATERGLRVLTEAGFPLGRALDALNSLSVFVIGHAAAEVGTRPVNEQNKAGSTSYLAGLDDGEFPLLVSAAVNGLGVDDEARFRFGVEAMIGGFGATIP